MSALTFQWVNRDNYTNYIGVLPASFSIDKIKTALNRIIESWLSDLMDETTLQAIQTDIGQNPNLSGDDNEQWSETTQKWMKAIVPFLVHASWSEYILTANVTYAVNGPVTVFSDGSEPISDQQRSKISQFHHGYAETYALKISRLAKAEKCGSVYVGSGRPTIKSAGGKRRSRFD